MQNKKDGRVCGVVNTLACVVFAGFFILFVAAYVRTRALVVVLRARALCLCCFRFLTGGACEALRVFVGCVGGGGGGEGPLLPSPNCVE